MDARERTFGFELEVEDNIDLVAIELNQRGLARGDHRHDWHCRCDYCGEYFGDAHNWYKVQRDSSCGGEIISSPLRWDWTGDTDTHEVDPAFLIDQLCEVLVGNDTPISDRCGLHVHVGALDLSDEQLGRLYQLMHHHEAILYRLACGRSPVHRGYSNQFNYCRPMSGFTNPVEARELAVLKTSKVKASPIAYNKYVMANMVPIEGLGTVEFRLWESTRSRRRLRLYAKLSVALVQRAKRRRRPVGPPLYLGDRVEDGEGLLLDFLHDLQRAAPSLVDDEFIGDAMWQWGEGPADWQEPVRLPPLPHYLSSGGLARHANDVDRVISQVDSHGNTIEVPFEHQEPAVQVDPDPVFTAPPDNGVPYEFRTIPAEHRADRMSSPNFDCGRPMCGQNRCWRNRRAYWHRNQQFSDRLDAELNRSGEALRRHEWHPYPRGEEPFEPFPVDPPLTESAEERYDELGRLR